MDGVLASLSDLQGVKATERQRAAVERLGLGAAPDALTYEQASVMLSARDYARGVLHGIGIRERDKRHQVIEAHLSAFIAADPQLRARVIAWNKRSFARGGNDGVAKAKKDEHWERVAAEAKRLHNRIG